MAEVVTLGEPMAVMLPSQPIPLDHATTLQLDVAGAESNLAIALARLGHSVRLVAHVGDDPFGARIRSVLEREGVDTQYVSSNASAPTGIYFREWLADGARRVYYYRARSAASRLAPEDLSPDMFKNARIVHLTGITPALSDTCAAAVARAIELAKAEGAQVSFDPNYRARLWSPEAARAALLPLIRQADMLLLGHEDAAAILGVESDEAILEATRSLGPRIVVLKLAERGAVAEVEGQRIAVPATPVAQVIDPVGAGDGFDAGFLSAMLRGESIEQGLMLGARIGAASVAMLGDYTGYPRING